MINGVVEEAKRLFSVGYASLRCTVQISMYYYESGASQIIERCLRVTVVKDPNDLFAPVTNNIHRPFLGCCM